MSKYPKVLKYYMWSYQVYFLIHCQTKSESIFDKLDRGLQSNITLLGFDDTYSEIKFEPENSDYLKPLFNNLRNLKDDAFKNHPDKNMFYTGVGMQEEMDLRMEKECWRLAIQSALNSSELGENKIFFVSASTRINENNVYVILELNKQVYNSHSHLKNQFYNERFRIYRSLLETTVYTFLSECRRELNFPNPGKDLNYNGRSWDEILREAAKQLTYTFSSKGESFEGLHGLYESCNSISINKYEGKENLGTLIITQKDNSSINYSLKLEEPFDLSDYRKTRKMLQLANDDVFVICNAHQVLGLGNVKTDYDKSTESIFFIKFRGVHCWEVWHADKAILVMKYGVPQFISEVIDKKIFYSDCRRIFNEIDDDQIENLYLLSVAATKQKNGALLIISDHAATESVRLKNQCLRIQPQKIDTQLLLSLTTIDGGVLINRDGVAYAHGVILDGIVTNSGDSARGSRYNSAVTYIEHKGKESKTLIIVVSEDGMVDTIPRLQTQIYRSEISRVIDVLREQLNDFDKATYNNAMSWLISRKSYLSQEQCEVINSIKNQIEKMPLGTDLRIVYNDIVPNLQLDDSYFLD